MKRLCYIIIRDTLEFKLKKSRIDIFFLIIFTSKVSKIFVLSLIISTLFFTFFYIRNSQSTSTKKRKIVKQPKFQNYFS